MFLKKKTIQDWNFILKIWFSGYLDIISSDRRDQITPKSHFKKIQKITKEFFGNIYRAFKRNSIPENKIWFLSLSNNNYDALKGIQNRVDNSILISFFSIKEKPLPNVYTFSLRRRFLYNLCFPLKIINYFFKNPVTTKEYYDLYFQSFGTNQECYRLIKKYKPKAIVFANDHVIIARSMLLSAKRLGVTTYYIQHASVSKYFPPLSFDYAFLEGNDSLEKYSHSGIIESKVFLTGMPKFDDYSSLINTNNKLSVLGIAYNVMDDISEVEILKDFLKTSFPGLNIIVRAHPSDKRKISSTGVSISNPREESAFEFLSKIDVIISGNSSIHLEAVLLNVYSIQYDFGSKILLDYYDFIKNNLVSYCKTIEEIKNKINLLTKEKPFIQDKAKYYNASIGTDFYGKSTEKILELINNTLEIE